MFLILLIAIAVVHLDLEYRIWIAKKEDIFTKYQGGSISSAAAAKWAYYAKSVWLAGLIFAQFFGIAFQTAVVFTFAFYAALLLVTLPIRRYTVANGLLAVACVLWWFLR